MPSVQHSPAPNCKGQLRDSQSTKLKLIKAALNAFTTQGFDASSTRGIENAAGIKRGLINYHFGSKAALWKASADHLMSITEQDLGAAVKEVENLEESQRLLNLSVPMCICADHPELNRLLIQEGMTADWRLGWLLDRSVRPWYRQVCKVFKHAKTLGLAPQMDPHHFYYVLTGAATLIFSNAAEAEALSGRNPLDPDAVAAHAEAVADLFIPVEKSR